MSDHLKTKDLPSSVAAFKQWHLLQQETPATCLPKGPGPKLRQIPSRAQLAIQARVSDILQVPAIKGRCVKGQVPRGGVAPALTF